jgi:hypothetical protein
MRYRRSRELTGLFGGRMTGPLQSPLAIIAQTRLDKDFSWTIHMAKLPVYQVDSNRVCVIEYNCLLVVVP